MTLYEKLRPHARQFGKYFLSGITANAIDIGGFIVLFHLGLQYVAASIVSGTAGFFTAFCLHKYVVFRKQERTGAHFVRFCALGVFNIIATSLLLSVFVEWAGLPEEVAKVLANGSQALWGFIIMKFLVYV